MFFFMLHNFSFVYPVTQRIPDKTRREGIRYDHTGDLIISGICNKPTETWDKIYNYEFEVKHIVYDGPDGNSNLTTGEMLENVNAACLNHVRNLLEDAQSNNSVPSHHKIGSLHGRVIPLQRLIKKVR